MGLRAVRRVGWVRGYLSGLLFPDIAVLVFDNVYDLPGD